MREATGRISTLNAEIDDLRKPKRTPFQIREHDNITALFKNYGEDEKTMLRHLRRHGKMLHHHSGSVHPLPTGFDATRAIAVFRKLMSDHITTSETHSVPGGWEVTWKIAPGAISTLDELL
jgi:hypothetical protein